MMNRNDEDIDLRLALGSKNYSVETRLNSSSGAGVNANSRVDMPFAASDPPSELVWSPHNGLSLKCANSSLANNKPFLKGGGDIKVSDEEKLSISPKMLDRPGNSGDKATVFRSCGGSSNSDVEASQRNCDARSDGEIGEAAIREENQRGNEEEDLCGRQNVQIPDIAESSKRNAEQDTLADVACDRKLDMAINWKFPSNLIRATRCNQNGKLEANASRSDIMGLAVPIRSEPHVAKVSEALVCSLPNLQPQQEPDDEVTSAAGDMNNSKRRTPISFPAPTLMKLESSAENDLVHLAAKESHNLDEMGHPRENSLPVNRAPTNNRNCLYREKGKEKASSDGDIYARSSNDEDDSHESVESCNSAALFSTGIKRRHYDEEQLVGSKKMRKQIEGNHGSTSIVKPDSSFMNWISNVVKGLSDSNKEEPSPLVLTLAHSNDVCSNNHQENFMCNKTTDCTRPNTGFQNVFQSLYCRGTNTTDSGAQKDNQSVQESKELMAADKSSLENLLESCDRNNDSSCKQIILSDQEVNTHLSGDPSKPWIFSPDFARRANSHERCLVEHKASDIPEYNRAKGELSPSGSLCVKVNSTAEKTSLDIPLPVSCMPEKSSPLSSLWITRLYTRTARLENCNLTTEEARDSSSDCPNAKLDSRANDVFSTDQKISESRDESAGDHLHPKEQEMQRFSSKASIDFKSTHKLSPVQLSQKLRSSEAMASVFAKRLDALRHIMHRSEKRKSPSCPLMCFFCGKSGHDLRKCPELTETELENLLVKISSFDKVEESPCLCIRCFQLDHWAISCPLVSLNGHRRSEQNAGATNHHTTCHLQLCADDKCSSHLGGEEDDCKQVVAAPMACSSKPFLSSSPNYLTWNVKESSSKRLSTSNEFQKSTSSNSESHLKDRQLFPPSHFVKAPKAVAQEQMFHAIRKLRLSRADILRWMNSNVSLSQLDGFFLRLRLGNVEGSLGGNSYYVACIIGDTIENIGFKSAKSILVDIGGIKSSVGSQYISNHDFLEDEIKAWSSRIVKTGGKIPSLDELNSKFEDRKRLGL